MNDAIDLLEARVAAIDRLLLSAKEQRAEMLSQARGLAANIKRYEQKREEVEFALAKLNLHEGDVV